MKMLLGAENTTMKKSFEGVDQLFKLIWFNMIDHLGKILKIMIYKLIIEKKRPIKDVTNVIL